jgi:hypothetical protein
MHSDRFTCPVCGYPDLEEPAYNEGLASFEICPCCRTQFGYQDATRSHADLRDAWLARGAPWNSPSERAPEGWDPMEQLRAAGLLAGS